MSRRKTERLGVEQDDGGDGVNGVPNLTNVSALRSVREEEEEGTHDGGGEIC